MDHETFAILEFGAPDRGELGFEPRAAAETEVTISTASLPPAEAADLARRPGTVAAPAMPLTLVEPLAADGALEAAGSAVAWGVDAVGASSSPFTGDGITVAILDTGIDAGHPAFPPGKVEEKDFVEGGPGDPNGHGTHCAGTVAGADVDGTRIGVAPGVSRILACKVLGGNGRGTAAIADALWWAVGQGAHVISMSLGIDFPGYVAGRVASGHPVQVATSEALIAYRDNLVLLGHLSGLIRARNAQGGAALVVAATGNESHRVGAGQGYTVGVAWPASTEGFLPVAAVGRAGGGLAVAPFSNTSARLAGPGVAVRSAWPGGGLRVLSGTSMATPHVAGVAALWAQQQIQQTGVFDVGGVEAMLIANCAPIPGGAWQDVGQGLVQAPQA